MYAAKNLFYWLPQVFRVKSKIHDFVAAVKSFTLRFEDPHASSAAPEPHLHLVRNAQPASLSYRTETT
jgi:hypothetical protein